MEPVVREYGPQRAPLIHMELISKPIPVEFRCVSDNLEESEYVKDDEYIERTSHEGCIDWDHRKRGIKTCCITSSAWPQGHGHSTPS